MPRRGRGQHGGVVHASVGPSHITATVKDDGSGGGGGQGGGQYDGGGGGQQSPYDQPQGDPTPWFDGDSPYQSNFDPGYDPASFYGVSGFGPAPARVAGVGADATTPAATSPGTSLVTFLLGAIVVYHGLKWIDRGFRPMRGR